MSEVVKKRNCTNVQCHTYNIQTGYVECTHEICENAGLGNVFIILDDTDHRQKNGREGFETRSIAVRKVSCHPGAGKAFL